MLGIAFNTVSWLAKVCIGCARILWAQRHTRSLAWIELPALARILLFVLTALFTSTHSNVTAPLLSVHACIFYSMQRRIIAFFGFCFCFVLSTNNIIGTTKDQQAIENLWNLAPQYEYIGRYVNKTMHGKTLLLFIHGSSRRNQFTKYSFKCINTDEKPINKSKFIANKSGYIYSKWYVDVVLGAINIYDIRTKKAFASQFEEFCFGFVVSFFGCCIVSVWVSLF